MCGDSNGLLNLWLWFSLHANAMPFSIWLAFVYGCCHGEAERRKSKTADQSILEQSSSKKIVHKVLRALGEHYCSLQSKGNYDKHNNYDGGKMLWIIILWHGSFVVSALHSLEASNKQIRQIKTNKKIKSNNKFEPR